MDDDDEAFLFDDEDLVADVRFLAAGPDDAVPADPLLRDVGATSSSSSSESFSESSPSDKPSIPFMLSSLWDTVEVLLLCCACCRVFGIDVDVEAIVAADV